jgi:DNA-binding HxlR family transcriptional regulator
MGSLSKDFRLAPPPDAARMVQQICGCKWSLTLYWLLANGINRPGAMSRSVEGLTPKVLNDCLRRNMDLGILQRQVFAEVPPRVEYHFTALGHKFLTLIPHLEDLQREIEAAGTPPLDAAQQPAD